jgi:hypothetical protein
MSRSKKGTFWMLAAIGLPFGFIVFMLAIVLYASIQDVQLVEDSYYERGLDYQDRIDRLRKARGLDSALVITQSLGERAIVLSGSSGITGTARLIRPSNSRYDFAVAVDLGSTGRQLLPTDEMIRGLWRLEVDWSLGEVGYYSEARVVIP